jgi:hypothetical protein
MGASASVACRRTGFHGRYTTGQSHPGFAYCIIATPAFMCGPIIFSLEPLPTTTRTEIGRSEVESHIQYSSRDHLIPDGMGACREGRFPRRRFCDTRPSGALGQESVHVKQPLFSPEAMIRQTEMPPEVKQITAVAIRPLPETVVITTAAADGSTSTIGNSPPTSGRKPRWRCAAPASRPARCSPLMSPRPICALRRARSSRSMRCARRKNARSCRPKRG